VVQISKDDKTKSVGIVKVNLADFIEDKDNGGLNGERQTFSLEKCPDKTANMQMTMRTTLVSSNAAGSDAISCMMSDIQSVDSGPESEYNFGDFESSKRSSRIGDSLKISDLGSKQRIKSVMKPVGRMVSDHQDII
jgi:hypothetical protein